MRYSFPKILLHLEGLAILVGACLAYGYLGDSWIQFAVWFLIPDLSMIGYLVNPTVGARSYNLVHTYVAPLALLMFVHLAHWPSFAPLCLIWISHIAFDRLLGYGLKYDSGFKDTDLSRV
jgi:hypothetical protein